jgi:hypothetical protein
MTVMDRLPPRTIISEGLYRLSLGNIADLHVNPAFRILMRKINTAPRVACWSPAVMQEGIAVVRERINDLATLELNWDLDGASRISSAAIRQAHSLIEEVYRAEPNGPSASAIPSPEGGIVLSWRRGRKCLLVKIPKLRQESVRVVTQEGNAPPVARTYSTTQDVVGHAAWLLE